MIVRKSILIDLLGFSNFAGSRRDGQNDGYAQQNGGVAQDQHLSHSAPPIEIRSWSPHAVVHVLIESALLFCFRMRLQQLLTLNSQ